jgi:DNA end-binding protein Ku
MAPPSLWSGNLRLSLVLIPVRLVPAVSTEEAISFRQIHEPSGTPIRQVKGVRDGDTFTEVPDEEIVKGYEYAKGHHVLIDPKEIDELKLEASTPSTWRASWMKTKSTAAIGRSLIT